MKKLLLIMVFCTIISQICIAQTKNNELINKQFFNNNTYVQNYDPYEDINEKYSYNEKEENERIRNTVNGIRNAI